MGLDLCSKPQGHDNAYILFSRTQFLINLSVGQMNYGTVLVCAVFVNLIVI